MDQEEEARAAVDAGIDWLDEKLGMPWEVIRLLFTEPVNVRSITDCPLAQATRMTYIRALREHGITLEDAAKLGFTVRQPTGVWQPGERTAFEKAWPALQAEWERRMTS